jgi:hypothetical protein
MQEVRFLDFRVRRESLALEVTLYALSPARAPRARRLSAALARLVPNGRVKSADPRHDAHRLPTLRVLRLFDLIGWNVRSQSFWEGHAFIRPCRGGQGGTTNVSDIGCSSLSRSHEKHQASAMKRRSRILEGAGMRRACGHRRQHLPPAARELRARIDPHRLANFRPRAFRSPDLDGNRVT